MKIQFSLMRAYKLKRTDLLFLLTKPSKPLHRLDLAPPQSKRFCHHVTQPSGGATRLLLRTTATSPSGDGSGLF